MRRHINKGFMEMAELLAGNDARRAEAEALGWWEAVNHYGVTQSFDTMEYERNPESDARLVRYYRQRVRDDAESARRALRGLGFSLASLRHAQMRHRVGK